MPNSYAVTPSAPVPVANCDVYFEAIEQSQKVMASEWARSVSDNSAPRETNTQLKINNELQRIQINISLLSLNKCSTLKLIVNPGAYSIPALKCSTANSKRNLAIMKGESDPGEPEECNWDTWTK